MSDQRPITILCLASEYKGIPFIQECAHQGAQVILLTPEKVASSDWPWDSIHLHHYLPNLYTQPNITHAVSYLARHHDIDRIVALDDYDVATAASLREHLRLPGLGETVARFLRDKLAMRTQARAAGLPVPDFVGLFNDEDVNEFMGRIAPPWVLKPRFEAGAVGIQKLHTADAVWNALHNLGDQRSFYLLEQFLPGDVFHVDVLRWNNDAAFGVASQYGAPPLSLIQGGGIFITRLLDREAAETQALLNLTGQLHDAFRLKHGVSHTEFIRANSDGRYYFLETSARVGGAHIDRMIEAATGIALWQEAARIELASICGETYQLPPNRSDYAGLIICLAREQWPDLSAYNDPEVVWRIPKENHAGLIVASPDAYRVEQLLMDYANRFGRDFLAHAPQTKEVRHTI
jgi:hypothetical protein